MSRVWVPFQVIARSRKKCEIPALFAGHPPEAGGARRSRWKLDDREIGVSSPLAAATMGVAVSDPAGSRQMCAWALALPCRRWLATDPLFPPTFRVKNPSPAPAGEGQGTKLVLFLSRRRRAGRVDRLLGGRLFGIRVVHHPRHIASPGAASNTSATNVFAVRIRFLLCCTHGGELYLRDSSWRLRHGHDEAYARYSTYWNIKPWVKAFHRWNPLGEASVGFVLRVAWPAPRPPPRPLCPSGLSGEAG